ncbi:hypothetical protein ACHAWF_005116 [Thalassiosira exigua]
MDNRGLAPLRRPARADERTNMPPKTGCPQPHRSLKYRERANKPSYLGAHRRMPLHLSSMTQFEIAVVVEAMKLMDKDGWGDGTPAAAFDTASEEIAVVSDDESCLSQSGEELEVCADVLDNLEGVEASDSFDVEIVEEQSVQSPPSSTVPAKVASCQLNAAASPSLTSLKDCKKGRHTRSSCNRDINFIRPRRLMRRDSGLFQTLLDNFEKPRHKASTVDTAGDAQQDSTQKGNDNECNHSERRKSFLQDIVDDFSPERGDQKILRAIGRTATVNTAVLVTAATGGAAGAVGYITGGAITSKRLFDGIAKQDEKEVTKSLAVYGCSTGASIAGQAITGALMIGLAGASLPLAGAVAFGVGCCSGITVGALSEWTVDRCMRKNDNNRGKGSSGEGTVSEDGTESMERN